MRVCSCGMCESIQRTHTHIHTHTSMIKSIQTKVVLIDLNIIIFQFFVLLICVDAIKINTIFSRPSSGYEYIILESENKNLKY